MMKKVVRQVVADVPEDATGEDLDSGKFIVGEDDVGQFVKGDCENEEESGWHNQPIFVHGKVVMDAVEQEMCGNADPIVGEIVVEVE